jgi:uncharacterized protein
MPDLPIILGIIFLAMLVQATFSFGGALVALPLLALFVEVKFATVLMTMLSATIAVVIVIRNRDDIQVQAAWKLIVSAFVGIPFGIFFLKNTDGSILKIVLAATVIVFTLLSLINFKGIRAENPLAAYIFGFVSGVFGGAYNISGPPVVLYGSLANWDSHHFRATIQSYALFTNIFAIIGHLLANNITPAVARTYLWALPVVALSIWLGTLIHNRIPSERYQIVVKILVLVLSARLLFLTIL